MRDQPRGPHAVWRWEWDEVEHLPVDEGCRVLGSRAVQILLGHASPTTMAVYTQSADAALVEAVLAAG